MMEGEQDERPGEVEREEFDRKVSRRETRKMKARREKHRNIWFGLGMFGLVGWSVAIPALITTAIGVWLDSKYSGRISWTLTLLFVGVALGCLNAWLWIKREMKDEEGKK